MRRNRKSLSDTIIRTLSALLQLWMAGLTSLANPFARIDF